MTGRDQPIAISVDSLPTRGHAAVSLFSTRLECHKQQPADLSGAGRSTNG